MYYLCGAGSIAKPSEVYSELPRSATVYEVNAVRAGEPRKRADKFGARSLSSRFSFRRRAESEEVPVKVDVRPFSQSVVCIVGLEELTVDASRRPLGE
jgi:hypothetical protein